MTRQPPRRLGIFGGTFDPVHYAHLLLAECCREECELDEVWLMPTASAPHKLQQQPTSALHRVAMLRLAIAGHEALQVCTLEVDRGGISYTRETLETLHERHPGTGLFFLMGADSLKDLPHWRDPQRILELAVPVVVRRPGAPEPSFEVLHHLVASERLERFRRHSVTMPLMEFSSSELRERVAKGLSIRYRTPRAVEKYIESNHLYQRSS